MKAISSNIIFNFLKLIFGLIILAYLISEVHIQQTVAMLKIERSEFLALGLSSFLLSILFDALRLHAVVFTYTKSVTETIKLYLLGSFVGTFLPSSLGNDAYITYNLSKKHRNLNDILTRIIIQRICGLAILAVFACIYMVNYFNKVKIIFQHITVNANLLSALVILSFIFLGVFIYLFFKKRQFINDKFNSLIKCIKNIGYKDFSKVMLLSFLFQFTQVLSIYFFIIYFDVNISLITTGLLIAFLAFVTLLPVSFDGLGLREGAMVVFLISSGVDKNIAISTAILFRIALWIPSMGGSIFYFRSNKMTKSRDV